MTAYEMLQKAQGQIAQAPATPQPVAPSAPVTAPAPAPAPRKRTPKVQAPAPAPAPAPARPEPVAIAKSAAPLPAPVINTPTGEILSRGVLVSFSCPIPGNEKVDRETTKKVQKQERFGEHSGKWDKTIFPPARYKALSSLAATIRSWHYANTLDWPQPGAQLLPTANHKTYFDGMREWKAKMEEAKEAFLAALPEMREWAQKEHNGSYDDALYNEDRIRAKFAFDIAINPLPASDHFVESLRSLLGADAASVDERVQNGIQAAEQNLWDRLARPLQNIQSILSKKDSGNQTRVTDSLLENVLSIARMIPALNLSENPALAALASDAEAAFGGFKTEDLAENKDVRAEAIKRASEILRRLTGARS